MLTTPADIGHFFALLLQGEVVSESASAAIYQILDQQAVSDRIPQLLPFNTKTVHKTGNLDQVVHDAGIIYTPRGPVILAALVQADPDDAQATLVIQQLARMVFDLAPLSS
jgi:beta-lactamase class A